jgi:hypothetical protein
MVTGVVWYGSRCQTGFASSSSAICFKASSPTLHHVMFTAGITPFLATFWTPSRSIGRRPESKAISPKFLLGLSSQVLPSNDLTERSSKFR